MSFWKTFGFHTVSAIDTLLEGGDFTLEQLLDEEEILQETKSQNKKLLDYLIEPESLKKLLYYITVEPQEEDDPKRKFKYPFLACEILASEVWAICDAIYQNQNLLDELFAYFEKDPPLNPLLSSYTSRVAGVLLNKKVPETIEYMKEKKDIIPHFLKHLGNASVMDLLLKVIACEDTPDGGGTLEWLCSTSLISELIGKFDPTLGVEVHENAGQALVDIIIVSMNSASSPLIAQLESEDIVKTLYGHILAGGLNSSLLHGLTVVIELLRRHVKERHDDTTTLDQLHPLLKTTIQHLPTLTQLLTQRADPTHAETTVFVLESSVGKIVPLGFERLKIVELLSALFMTNYQCIDAELMRLNVLSICLELFFSYPWNNFLHSIVESIVQGVLESENEELKISLLKDGNLLQRIVDASKQNEEECAKPRGIRRGFMGHITSISQSLLSVATVTPAIEKLLADHAEWNQYTNGALTATRERETRSLGGYMPDYAAEHAPDFEDDYEDDDGDFDDDDDDHDVFGYQRRDGFNVEEGEFRLDPDDDSDDDEDDDERVVAHGELQDDDDDDEENEHHQQQQQHEQQQEQQQEQHSVKENEQWTEKQIEDRSEN
jgi:hypothetical protein